MVIWSVRNSFVVFSVGTKETQDWKAEQTASTYFEDSNMHRAYPSGRAV
jgi:hypothetical protein